MIMRGKAYTLKLKIKKSGWLLSSSLEKLKASFTIPSDNQGSHPDNLSIPVYHTRCIYEPNGRKIVLKQAVLIDNAYQRAKCQS